MPSDYQNIYEHHAAEYDRLVAAEDCDGNLIRAIEAAAPFPLGGAHVLEVGAGTGRITRQLVHRAARVIAVDRAAAMLDVARRHLEAIGAATFELHCADAGELPVASGWADLAVAGWVFGHFRYWLPDAWRTSIDRALTEMKRVLRSDGAIIIIETLGTGFEEPRPPTPELADYYTWLESERGFTRTAIRTDYCFPDPTEAADTMAFFFGDPFAAEIQKKSLSRIPECTGIWSKHLKPT